MLETKIEELTKAIDRLTEVIIADIKQDIPSVNDVVTGLIETAKSVEQPTEHVAESVETKKDPEWVEENDDAPFEVIDFDQFKSQCLVYARKPEIGKTKVKDVLTSFGAAKASDVPEEKRQEVLKVLEGL
jgi:hypothetical protein